MRIKTIRQQHDVGIWLQLTAEMNRGQVVVEMRPDDATSDGTLLTATEARRLSKALLAFADGADRRNRLSKVITVSAETARHLVRRMKRPRKSTPAMRALFPNKRT